MTVIPKTVLTGDYNRCVWIMARTRNVARDVADYNHLLREHRDWGYVTEESIPPQVVGGHDFAYITYVPRFWDRPWYSIEVENFIGILVCLKRLIVVSLDLPEGVE